jgi:GxxExxY protein
LRCFAPLRETNSRMTENEIARKIVDVAFKIHSHYGPGLLESVYESIMAHELNKRGMAVSRQQPIPLVHETIRMNVGFRADLVVAHKVVVEIKSIQAVGPVHKKQLLTYLRLADKRLGLLINFNVELIKHGISRVVNGLVE